MRIRAPLLAAVLTAASLTATLAVSADQSRIETTPLSGLDLFSAGNPGLGADLWRGSSAEIARATIPAIGTKPLSPAARRLAIRLLSTGANAPEGAGSDPALAAARARALIALGEPAAANASVERAPNMAANEPLSQAAAEAALLVGDDARACAIGEALQSGRDGVYWLKLRAYCQAIANQPGASLTLTLALEKAKDPVYARLMAALVAGAGDPGAPSDRNGLERALSRRLNLPLPPAPHIDPIPPTTGMAGVDEVREAIALGDPQSAKASRAGLVQDAAAGLTANTLAMLDALIAAATGDNLGPTLDRLIERGDLGGPKSAAQPAAIILAALGGATSPDARAEFARFDVGKTAASPARLAALDRAAEAGLKGETALLVLSIAQDAGAAGPAPADRARIIQALRKVGLEVAARDFAVEGLMALSFK
ncbi:hypothetical protein QO010_004421 [Caulobacter ginsengisoli]|uniref:Antifreeze glycopeptide polyprotein n=1 Tax=Caulobacter ginsengisoli TaxID=400775 RepID=A0ABU0IXB4_9CAUL|nr:hypothetical protein [Caulobacter ginsengisoli]MDQ0466625.1 hypothetical protein [Caulobacter ginsengisoli]